MEKTGRVVTVDMHPEHLVHRGVTARQLIEPTAAEKERIYTDRIDYVRTKDWKVHEFVEPPVVANDTIVGWYAQSTWCFPWDVEQVSIPLSDVAEVIRVSVQYWEDLDMGWRNWRNFRHHICRHSMPS